MKTKFSGLLTLLLALVVQITFAQEQQTVTGTVTDESGMPLPGVNVLIKGTTRGVQTDFDGNYSIEASQGEVLVFSYLGMKTAEYTVGDIDTIDVVLTPDAAQLEEVVVTAFGIERPKRSLAYTTEAVGEELLNQAQPVSASSALAGKVAGLQINVQNNGVNPSSQIILRGLRSISQSNSALIVIDGIIATQATFDALNPNDIASLNVLKGATAAALYGSQAGNGAIIVETKSGNNQEAFTVGLNTVTTFENVAYMPEFQSEFGIGWAGAYDNIENTNWGPRFDGQLRQIGPTFPEGYPLETQMVPYAPVQDNLKDFYNTGITLQNTVYLNGGNENSSFRLSLGDLRTEGIVPNDEYVKNTFNFSASQRLGDLELSATANYFTDQTDVVGGSIGDQNRPLYWFILNTPANIPLSSYKDWDNPNSYAYADNYFNAYYQNPYWAIGTNRNTSESDGLFGTLSGDYDINSWLSFTASAGIERRNGFGKNWRAAQTYDPVLQPAHSDVSSFVVDSEFQYSNYEFNGRFNLDFDITEDVSIDAILGATTRTTSVRQSSIRADNLSIEGFYDVSNGTGVPTIDVNESKRRLYGAFGEVVAGYKNFLSVSASGRYDATSTLPEAERAYFYPAYGASIILNDAIEGLRNSEWLSYFKIYGNNSTVYNDLAPYQVNETYSQSAGFPFGNINGFFLSGTAVDSSIKKEKINTTEIGTNLAFFSNRITLDAAYFKTLSTDLITFTTPSVASGSGTYLTNIGELEGDGFEVSLGADIFRGDDFKWDVNVNYTTNKVVVNEITEGVNEVTVTSTGQVGIFAIVGEEFPQIKASSYVRDPQGRVVVDEVSGNPLVGSLKKLGKTTPDYIIGLTSQIAYKGFSLSGTVDYRTGHVYYEQGSDAMEFTGRSMESVSANREDFVWPNSVINTGTAENPVYVENTNIPITNGRMEFWQNTFNEIKENYVKDATALKIREIALNYTLPETFLGETFSALRVGVIARNLLTWLPEENRFSDPEFNNTNSNAIGIGGYFQSPPTRSVGVSLNLEF